MSLRDYHSQYWLAYGYLQQGRYAEAWKIWDAKKRDIVEAQGDGEVYRYWAELGASLVTETGAWDRAEEVFKDPVTIRRSGGDSHMHAVGSPARALEGFVKGLAAARKGEPVAPWLDLLEQARSMAVQRDQAIPAARYEAQQLMVRAAEARKAGRAAEAVEFLAKAAVLEEKDAQVSGPPDIVKPSHEMAGEVLMEMGKAAEALKKFQKALERQPNRSLSVQGALRAAEKLGDKELVESYGAALRANWANADSQAGAGGR